MFYKVSSVFNGLDIEKQEGIGKSRQNLVH